MSLLCYIQEKGIMPLCCHPLSSLHRLGRRQKLFFLPLCGIENNDPLHWMCSLELLACRSTYERSLVAVHPTPLAQLQQGHAGSDWFLLVFQHSIQHQVWYFHPQQVKKQEEHNCLRRVDCRVPGHSLQLSVPW